MIEFKMSKCPWTCIGENTAGFVYWCENCGAVYSEGWPPELLNPVRKDPDYSCPDQHIY